jgi:prolyl oligopeptidase
MTIQHAGSDWGTIKVMDVETRKFSEKDVIQWTKHTGITWTQDSKGFFYQAYDPPKSAKGGIQDGHAGQETDKLENQKVFYHYLGTDQKDDILIYQNKENPEWIFGAEITNDGKYLLIASMKGTDRKNLIHYLDIS